MAVTCQEFGVSVPSDLKTQQHRFKVFPKRPPRTPQQPPSFAPQTKSQLLKQFSRFYAFGYFQFLLTFWLCILLKHSTYVHFLLKLELVLNYLNAYVIVTGLSFRRYWAKSIHYLCMKFTSYMHFSKQNCLFLSLSFLQIRPLVLERFQQKLTKIYKKRQSVKYTVFSFVCRYQTFNSLGRARAVHQQLTYSYLF